MLRITVEKNDGVIIFRLEGKLKGEWVAELERCWIYARNTSPTRQLCIDLSSVDFVDESGRALLVRMVSEGANFCATNPMMASFVNEIKRLSKRRVGTTR
jgi:anti-anti-sigma regulatory factor